MEVTGTQQTGSPGALTRATELAREDAGVDRLEFARRVLASAARFAGRPGHPAIAEIPGGAVWVSDVVLRRAVGRAVAALADVAPVSVRFRFDGDRLVGVTTTVAVVFGAAIGPAGTAVRAAVREQLDLLLATPLIPDLAVEVVDVVEIAEMPARRRPGD